MKRIILIISFFAVAFILQAMDSASKTGTKEACSTNETSYSFYNVHAYGDQLLNVQEYNSLSEMLLRGYLMNVAIKASTDCTYSWNKNYTEDDVIGNTVNNVPIPWGVEYTVTLKVESQCVYDYFLGRSIKFVWTKSVASNNYNSSAELGYPTKTDCANVSSLADRQELVQRYKDSDRIASSSIKLAL